MKVSKHERLSNEFFNKINSEWLVTEEIGDYVQGDIVHVSEREVSDFYNAANQLYDMFVEAGNHIIENNLFEECKIDPNLVEMIKYTWEHNNHWHMYGRFDFAGGIDCKQIKVLEFNADTPSSVPETAIIQWAQLMNVGMDPDNQFNNIYENLVLNFEHLKELNPDKHPAVLFSHMDSWEDRGNIEFIAQAAKEAGFEVEYRSLPEIHFSDDKKDGGVWVKYGEEEYKRFDFWFRLLPWEYLCEDEPKLIKILTKIVKNEQCVILNPAYTMLFQNKYILKILWDLFPNHPLLLETSNKPLLNKAQVQKVLLGREGANITIFDEFNNVVEVKSGDYGKYDSIYQEYTELVVHEEQNYQAGVFFIGEGAGLVFRRDKDKIIHDTAQFVSHVID